MTLALPRGQVSMGGRGKNTLRCRQIAYAHSVDLGLNYFPGTMLPSQLHAFLLQM